MYIEGEGGGPCYPGWHPDILGTTLSPSRATPVGCQRALLPCHPVARREQRQGVFTGGWTQATRMRLDISSADAVAVLIQ